MVIPEKMKSKLLDDEHPGASKMKSVARSYFWSPKLDHDIENVAKSCMECQAVKKSPAAASLHPWSWPSRVYQRIHVDFMGPFQGAMFLVIVDAYSKWPDVIVMQNTSASKTIDCLQSLFCSFGYPEQLVSDNSPWFISEEFEMFLVSSICIMLLTTLLQMGWRRDLSSLSSNLSRLAATVDYLLKNEYVNSCSSIVVLFMLLQGKLKYLIF